MDNLSGNSMQPLAICEECGEPFTINTEENKVTFKKKYECNGQTIFLTYYDCPKCGRRHYVQIDTVATLQELREVERMFVKMAAAKSKGKQSPKNQSAKFKKAREHLTLNRKKLMDNFTGKLLHDSETDKDVTLTFSV